jgi:RND family efflux transporter MFP subunit
MARSHIRLLVVLALLLVLGLVGLFLFRGRGKPEENRREQRVASVEVAAVEQRPLDLERTFSGALEPGSELVVAPKVSGRVERLAVDMSDTVHRGQIVAFLDDAEYAQAVKQAEAELAVANANLTQAKSAVEISQRENQRIAELRQRGIASDSEYDVAQADLLRDQAQVRVAEAQVNRAEATLESARIRYEYTRVSADWSEGDSNRLVAERFVDEGDTVSANQPLFRVVQLDPVLAVLSVTERDYGRLAVGMEARLMTDAFPREVFRGQVARIAPVFSETSRQARVELALTNPDGRLKPGMFIRATITLGHVEKATAVPEAALTRREDVEGVFAVDETGQQVQWIPVETGIRSGGWVQVVKPALSGRVVTLGQHLVDDGAPVRIVAEFESKAR